MARPGIPLKRWLQISQQHQRPEIKIGLLVRDCNQRALNVLYVWNQLNPEQCGNNKHKLLSFQSQGTWRLALIFRRNASGSYKKQVGIDNNMDVENAEEFSQEERFQPVDV